MGTVQTVGHQSGQQRAGRLRGALLVLALLTAACGGATTATGDGGAPTTAPAPVQPAAAATPTPTPSPGPATSEAADLPGEDVPGPAEGDALAVVGVTADDTLNVRAVPGTAGEVVAVLEPHADSVVTTGGARLVEDGVWYEVETDAADSGWVNARYLAYLGDVTDITSELAERPETETMVELADAVAELRMPSGEEGAGPTVVISDGPSVGDLGEVTVDVVGLLDDSVKGERLHLFANRAESGEGFVLRTVERTLLCARGVSDGMCV